MKAEDIQALVENQRSYFRGGATLPVEARLSVLKCLLRMVEQNEATIIAALQADLGKGVTEATMCEIGMVKSALRHMIKNVRRYARDKVVMTPLAQFPALSIKKPAPYGVCLVMSPWNYPFLLSMEPLIEAIAAGNTVVLKPSAYAPKTSILLKQLLGRLIDARWVTVVTGGREENSTLLSQHFDKIFFTGSQAVGKEVMRRAAEHLTPVTLELGGKSPCIVDYRADIEMAARRIVFGKFLNCGQTCVAPDYVLCDSRIKEELVCAIKAEIVRQYGANPLRNADYGRIVNEKHFMRLSTLMQSGTVVHGGEMAPDCLQIAPTVLTDVTANDTVMQEEIFGPILPILTYEDLDIVIDDINAGAHPLALYIFTKNRYVARKVMTACQFGGGCVNDTIIHLASNRLPFGGVGESGMGSYHGLAGFYAFSHDKSIVYKSTLIDLPIRYQPYTVLHDRLIRLFMR